jgi:hypothetical protein
MAQIAVSDRIVWQGKKAVVKRLWKNKVRIILSDLSEETVAISDVEPWIDPPNGQLTLIDVSRYESKRDFRDWELENQDVIPDPNLDPNSIDPNPIDPNLDPNSIDPNLDPNPIDPNPIDPNLDPNPIDPNSLDPNLDPNPIDPNSLDPNSHRNLDPNSKGYEEIKIIKGKPYRYWRWYEGGKKRSRYLGKLHDD